MYTQPIISWLSPPQKIHLSDNTIHVWHLDLSTPITKIASAMASLSQTERLRAERLKSTEHVKRFILTHIGLREILSCYTAQAPKNLDYHYNAYGKPALTSFPELHFNLSHSQDLGLCAITLGCPLGIDVENHKKKRDYLGIAKRFFSSLEYTQLCALPPSEQMAAFFRVWTCKEAFVKAIGEGLHYPLNQFSVNTHLQTPPALCFLTSPNTEKKDWRMHDFIPATDYTAALALPRSLNDLVFFKHSFNFLDR